MTVTCDNSLFSMDLQKKMWLQGRIGP